MRTAAGFHHHLGGRQFSEEIRQARPPYVTSDDRPIMLVDGIQRENSFGRVDGNALILRHVGGPLV